MRLFAGPACAGTLLVAHSLHSEAFVVTDAGVIVSIRRRVDRIGTPSGSAVIDLVSTDGRAHLSLDDLPATASLRGMVRVSLVAVGVQIANVNRAPGARAVTVPFSELAAALP